VRLRAAGKTLIIEVVGDSLRVEEMAATPVPRQQSESGGLLAMFGFGSDDDADEMEVLEGLPVDEMMEGEQPWYKSTNHLIAGVGLTVAVLIMLFLVIRRRYTDVMDGLEEFDDDSYLEDEDDDG